MRRLLALLTVALLLLLTATGLGCKGHGEKGKYSANDKPLPKKEKGE